MNELRTIKSIPASQRPYERCLAQGAEVLNDAELLAVILRTGTVGENSLELAARLLKIAGAEGLPGLVSMTTSQFRQVKGIGKVKAIQLQCIGELSKRIAHSRKKERISMASPSEIAAYYMEEMRHNKQEVLRLLMLDSKYRLICDSVISKGTVNASIASPREIFLTALHNQAVGIILVHNHPSGDPEPSYSDIEATAQIYRAGELVGITLADHIIIGDRCYCSLKERGVFNEIKV